MVLNAPSTPSLADGNTYRCSSLTSLHLQAKGSEYSLATRRRVPERNSPNKRQDVGVRNSSSGPCVLSLSIEPDGELLTKHFRAAAKVIHSRLRWSKKALSSPPVNNFGGTISAAVLCRFEFLPAWRKFSVGASLAILAAIHFSSTVALAWDY